MILEESINLAIRKNEPYVFNQITGQLICIPNGEKNKLFTAIQGDSKNPEILAELLFGDDEILEGWDVIPCEKGIELFRKVWEK